MVRKKPKRKTNRKQTPGEVRSPRQRRTLPFVLLVLTVLAVGAILGGSTLWMRSLDSTAVRQPNGSATKDKQPNDREKKHDAATGSATNEWPLEEFALRADEQLHALADILSSDESLEEADLDQFIIDSFTGVAIRPSNLIQVADEEDSIVVLRPEQPATATGIPATGIPATGDADSNLLSGSDGFRQVLLNLAAPIAESAERRYKFKIVRVEQGNPDIETRVLLQANGTSATESVQQNAELLCRWNVQRGEQDTKPTLTGLRALTYEQVRVKGSTGTMFSDCTESLLGELPSYSDQIRWGIDHWRARTQAQHGVLLHGHHGLAVGDVNQDGLDDLYVCQPSGLPNRLYLQSSDGSVREASQEAGIDWLDQSRTALLIDLDNDADQDLAVMLNSTLMLLSNDDGRFTEQAVIRLVGEPSSIAAADYDHDGDLDIYVCSYGVGLLRFRPNVSDDPIAPTPYYDATNGGANVLLRNDGMWRFFDATAVSGMSQNNDRWSFAANWEDYDNDGDSDLYVANDFGRNNLYRNEGGSFVDVADTAGVEDMAAGMSVAWGDYNSDGWVDLYVSNMFSSAGSRITHQDRFKADQGQDIRGLFQRHARGNSLFLNSGNGTFRDVSESAGVTVGRWAWGSNFADLNNDGREDIVVANGFVTGPATDDL